MQVSYCGSTQQLLYNCLNKMIKGGFMVAGVSYDENALLFVQSLRPYLGPHGNGCLIALESLLELLHSEPAKKTLDSLRILGQGGL